MTFHEHYHGLIDESSWGFLRNLPFLLVKSSFSHGFPMVFPSILIPNLSPGLAAMCSRSWLVSRRRMKISVKASNRWPQANLGLRAPVPWPQNPVATRSPKCHSIESWWSFFCRRVPRSWMMTNIPNKISVISIIPELITNQPGFWTLLISGCP